jgi:alginate O-acetyltransferase complex protein AlgI
VVFSSVAFLFLFLPLTLVVYFCTPWRLRNLVLIMASVFFYAWGAGDFVLIMLASTLVDWGLARLIEVDKRDGNLRSARLLLFASIGQNLAILCYYKYAGFFVDEVTSGLADFGLGSPEIVSIALPIGVSFFTFEKISYTVDVWRGDVAARRNPLDVVLFVSLFPRAIAGPIVRLREIENQLERRRVGLDDLVEGATRFAHGLVKKVVIADSVAPIADAAFATQGHGLTTTGAWIGAIAFTLQIYFDFSGYSDMAIGIARMLGFVLPENFNRPYSAVSITDFWRRWHMTLSRWFRDYVYIPLGGSRDPGWRTYRNLVLTFLLTGFWHGAAWTFVVWGGYHGALMLLERVTGQRPVGDGRVSAVVLRRAVVLLLVIVGWVLFRADTLPDAGRILQAMFTPSGWEVDPRVNDAITNQALIVGALATLVVLLPRGLPVGRLVAAGRTRVAATGRVAIVGAALPVALVLVVSGTFSPFLYFRF